MITETKKKTKKAVKRTAKSKELTEHQKVLKRRYGVIAK